KAIDAAVLAASVWINARVEADVRTVVVINDASGFVPEENCFVGRILRFVPLRCLVGRLLESICRITRRSAAPNPFCAHWRILMPNHESAGTNGGTGTGISQAWVGFRDERKF